MKILLVDDHKIFRQGIRKLLEQQSDMEVIGEADDGRLAWEMARKMSPDVVVMDVTMPKLNGIDATRRILEVHPYIKIIALSMHSKKHLIRGMLEAGASGYLLKECAFEELVNAIRMAVEKDQIFMSPEVSQIVVSHYLNPQQNGETGGSQALTSKEREILQLIAEGKTSRGIGEIMGMSPRTVEKYRPKIMQKVKAENLAELIRYAIKEGLVSP